MNIFTIPSTGAISPGTRPPLALPWPGDQGRTAQAPIEPAKAPRDIGGRPAPQRDSRDATAAPRDQGLAEQRRSLPAVSAPLDEPATQPGASSRFLAQFLAQAETGAAGPRHQGHEALALGSEAYRRAGGQPPLYSEEPIFIRVDV